MILLLREQAATERRAASQMGRVVGKTATKWFSQRLEVIGVRRKTSLEDEPDLHITEQLKCRGTSINRASLNTQLSPFSSKLHEHGSHVEQRGSPSSCLPGTFTAKQKSFWLSVSRKPSYFLKKNKIQKTLL